MKHVKPLPRSYYSSVSPKGQITLPADLRKKLGIKPKDHVRIVEQEDGIFIKRVPRFSEFFMSIPALKTPMSVEEMTELVAEEHAQEVMRQGL